MSVVDPWTMPEARARRFWPWATGSYLGGIDEIPDVAPRELLVLESFEDERLKVRTTQVSEEQADRHAGRTTRKACAGRKAETTCTGPELRRAIARGRLSDVERATWRWTLSGIRSEHLYQLYARWRLSIYELARINALEFDGKLAMSAWLNLWGSDPSRPLPEGYDGMNVEERARKRGFLVRDGTLRDVETNERIGVVPGPWGR